MGGGGGEGIEKVLYFPFVSYDSSQGKSTALSPAGVRTSEKK